MREYLLKAYRLLIPILIRDFIYLLRNPEERYYKKILEKSRKVIKKAIITSAKRKDIQSPIFEIGAGGTYNKEIYLKFCTDDHKYYISNIEVSHVENGFDLICDGRRLPLRNNSVGTIVCSEVLEHIAETDLIVEEIHRVLKEGGIGVITTPFYFPIHEFPRDYYRFTPDGLRHICRRFSFVECSHDNGIKPCNILTILKK
jgi:SAM-dependent methyltransferase